MTDFPKPSIRPQFTTGFSCGPTAKFPGWKLEMLKGALVGRSHRAAPARAKIRQVGVELREMMGLPDDYLIGIMSGSDTGAVEAVLWNVLGQRPVDVFGWEAFGNDWVVDVVSQLKCEHRAFVGKYGELPPLEQANPKHDIVFTWNGTAAGVKAPDGAGWIADDREGLAICDATSAIFGMPIPWKKLDVVTFSWQKVLGGEPQHGMLVLGPRAVERLRTYTPSWPIPKLFRLMDKGVFMAGIFDDAPINTPSLLCIEDLLVCLELARKLGGQEGLIKRSRESYAHLKRWVDKTDWIDFLPKVDAMRSNTSPCLVIKDAQFAALSESDQRIFCKGIVDMLEAEGVGFDFNGYKDAPPGLRIWCGPTVEPSDVDVLTQWLDWAYHHVHARTFAE
jgi:phosphoserine aminotransferase